MHSVTVIFSGNEIADSGFQFNALGESIRLYSAIGKLTMLLFFQPYKILSRYLLVDNIPFLIIHSVTPKRVTKHRIFGRKQNKSINMTFVCTSRELN